MSHKKMQGTMIVLCLCLVLFGCSSQTDVAEHKSKEELEIGYYYYEGVFLSTEEVTEAFRNVSDEFPRYPIVSEPFHITTAARYTNYMDFSDSDPVDFILTGTFGWCDSDDSLVLESKD